MYINSVLLALDRLGNALLAGDDEETISERSGKALDKSEIARALCGVLDAVDADHCIDSTDWPMERKDELRAAFNEWKKRRDPNYGPRHEAPQAP